MTALLPEGRHEIEERERKRHTLPNIYIAEHLSVGSDMSIFIPVVSKATGVEVELLDTIGPEKDSWVRYIFRLSNYHMYMRRWNPFVFFSFHYIFTHNCGISSEFTCSGSGPILK